MQEEKINQKCPLSSEQRLLIVKHQMYKLFYTHEIADKIVAQQDFKMSELPVHKAYFDALVSQFVWKYEEQIGIESEEWSDKIWNEWFDWAESQ